MRLIISDESARSKTSPSCSVSLSLHLRIYLYTMALYGHPSASQKLPEYYLELDSPEINSKFSNFDTEESFPCSDSQVRDPLSRNFVVDFSDEEAWCAFDLSEVSIGTLVRALRPPNLNTRWINIWQPHVQQEVISVIGKHYEFSPRLLALMCSEPLKPRFKPPSSVKSSLSDLYKRARTSPQLQRKGLPHDSVDVEDQLPLRDYGVPADFSLGKGINQYSIADAVFHWSSVDWGRRYVCLGYNSLYKTEIESNAMEDEFLATSDLPAGKRVWSWLLLCEDRTVITITEDAFPQKDGQLSPTEHRSVATIRRNLINVFRQCSKGYNASDDNPLMQLPIRKRVGDSAEEAVHRPADAPGLLFYCMYDDWYASYSLAARAEHQYGAKLNALVSDSRCTSLHFLILTCPCSEKRCSNPLNYRMLIACITWVGSLLCSSACTAAMSPSSTAYSRSRSLR